MALTIRLIEEEMKELKKISDDLNTTTNSGTIKKIISEFLQLKQDLLKTNSELRDRENELKKIKTLYATINDTEKLLTEAMKD